jgi:fatty acid desaturase
LPYFPWKFIHHEHHTWTGNLDRDPTLYQVRKMKREGHVPWPVRFAWRSWIPFAGLLQHTVFWLYPFRSWRDGRFNASQQRKSLFSVLFLASAYILLGLFGPSWLTLARLWPSLIIYLVAVELVNFPHHIDMPVVASPDTKLAPWEQHVTTRSCDYGHYSGMLVLNFNLHTEHHLYPTLPWYRLKTVRGRVKQALAADYNQVTGIGWNIDNRTRDPREIMLQDKVVPTSTTKSEKTDLDLVSPN